MMPYAEPLFDRPGALGAVATPCLLYLVIISPALFSQWQRDLRRFVDPEKVELDCITAIESGNAATRRTSFTKYRGLMYQKDMPERSIIILTAYQVSLHGRFASPRYRQLLTPSHACADRLDQYDSVRHCLFPTLNPKDDPQIQYHSAQAGNYFSTINGKPLSHDTDRAIADFQQDESHPVYYPSQSIQVLSDVLITRIAFISEIAQEGVNLFEGQVLITIDGHWSPSQYQQLVWSVSFNRRIRSRFIRSGPHLRPTCAWI